jgi:hypothetical protein
MRSIKSSGAAKESGVRHQQDICEQSIASKISSKRNKVGTTEIHIIK